MLDLPLAKAVLRAIPTGAVVVLVGDIDQLPSVGPGSVLADIINADIVSVVRLNQVFRQGEGSRIVAAAHAIHAGEFPHVHGGESDFYFVECDDPAEIARKVVKLASERIPAKFGADPVADVQTLVPMRRGPLGALALNAALQAALNPNARGFVERFGTKFQLGDRVIQTENDYERQVFNGDLGRVRGLDEETQELAVEFDGRTLRYAFGELDALQLAYCLTIHKSQGSEYPFVLLPLHTSHFMMLQRNLLYTAVTRGRQLVALVGSRRAVEMAIARTDSGRRAGRLKERLQAALR
jgi:exodeoxyribonuclease V alpha subunit